jgi:6-phosphogluconolactonase
MPSVLVFSNLSTLSQYAARQFDRLAEQAVLERGRFLTALSGGGTPEGLYRLLAQPPYTEKTWWKKTHLFWGDERCVPPGDPESCYGQVNRLLLGSIKIPANHVHRINGEMQPGEAAAVYSRNLAQFAEPGLEYPHFDLVLLGMGTDGHTASLFPGSEPEMAGTALAVTAQYQDRPARRVTLSPRVLNAARQVFFMAVGANKADTLVKVLTGPVDELNLPSQRIRPLTGEVTWLVDAAAAEKLPENIKIYTYP